MDLLSFTNVITFYFCCYFFFGFGKWVHYSEITGENRTQITCFSGQLTYYHSGEDVNCL